MPCQTYTGFEAAGKIERLTIESNSKNGLHISRPSLRQRRQGVAG